MIAYTLIVLFVWMGTILTPFWVASSLKYDEIDARDKELSAENSKTTHFLRG